jgi:hypothetical protein
MTKKLCTNATNDYSYYYHHHYLLYAVFIHIFLRQTMSLGIQCCSCCFATVYGAHITSCCVDSHVLFTSALSEVCEQCPIWQFSVVLLLLLLLLLVPLFRAFIHLFLRQTMSLRNTMLQLFCHYCLWYPYHLLLRWLLCTFTSALYEVRAVPNMAVFCSSLTSWFPGRVLTYFLNDF